MFQALGDLNIQLQRTRDYSGRGARVQNRRGLAADGDRYRKDECSSRGRIINQTIESGRRSLSASRGIQHDN